MFMREISFIELECFFAVIWLVCRIIVWIRQGYINRKREAVLLLMYVNLAVIIRSPSLSELPMWMT